MGALVSVHPGLLEGVVVSVHAICQCGQGLRGGDEQAGKPARCPTCGAVLTFPASRSTPTNDEPLQPPDPEGKERLAVEPHPSSVEKDSAPATRAQDVGAGGRQVALRRMLRWALFAVGLGLLAGTPIYYWRMTNRRDDRAFAQARMAEVRAGENYEEAIEGYRAYLAAFPSGYHASAAREKAEKVLPEQIDDREFAKARDEAEAAGKDYERGMAIYHDYLRRFPSGKHRELARRKIERELPQKIEDRELNKTRKAAAHMGEDYERAIQAWCDYLQRFPSSTHRDWVRREIQERLPAKIDDRQFAEAAMAANGAGEQYERAIAAYRNYLDRFPHGTHVQEARARIRQLSVVIDDRDYARAQRATEAAEFDRAKTERILSGYLGAHPKGRHAERARRLLASDLKAKARDFAFSTARRLEEAGGDSLEQARVAYQHFLAKYPDAPQAGEARRRLASTLPPKIEEWEAQQVIGLCKAGPAKRAERVGMAFLDRVPEGKHAAAVKRALVDCGVPFGFAGPWVFQVRSFRVVDGIRVWRHSRPKYPTMREELDFQVGAAATYDKSGRLTSELHALRPEVEGHQIALIEVWCKLQHHVTAEQNHPRPSQDGSLDDHRRRLARLDQRGLSRQLRTRGVSLDAFFLYSGDRAVRAWRISHDIGCDGLPIAAILSEALGLGPRHDEPILFDRLAEAAKGRKSGVRYPMWTVLLGSRKGEELKLILAASCKPDLPPYLLVFQSNMESSDAGGARISVKKDNSISVRYQQVQRPVTKAK